MRKVALLIFLGNLVFSQNAVQIKANTAGQLIIEVSIDSAWISSKDKLVKTKPGLTNYLNPASPIIPYWEDVFVGLPADAQIQIYRGETLSLGNYKPVISGPEQAKGAEFKIPVSEPYKGTFDKNLVRLSAVKDVNNLPASKVEIFPFQISNGLLSVTKTFSVQITWNTAKQYSTAQQLSLIASPEIFHARSLKKTVDNRIPEYQFFPNIAKITIDSTGWYRISNNELFDKGIDFSGIAANTIRLWNKDDEIRLYLELGDDDVFNADDVLIFRGKKNPSPEWADYDNNFYTDDNIYWLTWGTGNGLRYSDSNVAPSLPINDVIRPVNFVDTLKFERDDKYVRIPKIDEYIFQTWDVIDHFFMLPQIIVSGPFDFNFQLDSPDITSQDGFDIEVQVRGMTTMTHDLDIYINNNLIGEAQWSARAARKINISNIACSYLVDGTNTLSLVLSPDDPSANDLIYLNWFELKYPRLFETDSDYIKYSDKTNSEQMTQFEISGFTNDNIYLMKNEEEVLTSYQRENDGKIVFQDKNTNPTTYEVFSGNTLQSAKDIRLESPILNVLEDISNEYVIVAPDSFFAILEPLANYHDAILLDIEEIYRQYSHGILSPYGLKSFLEDIYYENDQKLKYVLLAMTCDEIDWWNGRFSRIPSIPGMFIYTYDMGVVVCDHWYGSFSTEFWVPQLNVGRFPINSKAELQNIVDKTMNHHTRDEYSWDNNILLIGGTEIGFNYQNESLLDNIKQSGNFISRLYVAQASDDSTFYGTADTLANHFSRGMAYINFFGHGGGRVWEDNGLLTFSNINNLNNGRKLPFITSMSCHTGDFSYANALSRRMVEYPDGGALAWYSASGLGWYYNDYYMTIPLQDVLFSEQDLSIGEIINLAKTKYYIRYSTAYPKLAGSQVYQYNLIGDPATKLKNSLFEKVSIDPLDPEPEETIELTPATSIADSLYYQLFLPDNHSINHSILLDNTEPYELTLDENLKKGNYSLNLAYKSDEELINSSQHFTIAGSYINIIGTEPVNPTICDSIQIFAEVVDRNGVATVQLFINNEYWSDMVLNESNVYESDRLIPPQPSGKILNISCQAIDAINDTTESLVFPISIGEIPDISPVAGQFKVDEAINLVVDIESTTDTPVEVFSDLYILNNETWQLTGQDTIFINGKEIQQAAFSGFFPAGVNEYQVITYANLSCQSTNIVSDDTLYFELETNAFWVTPEHGSTEDGIKHAKVGIDNIVVEVQPGEVGQAQILQIKKLNEVNIVSQPDFSTLRVNNDYDGFEIIADDVAYIVTWQLDSVIKDYTKNLFQYFAGFQVWLALEFLFQSDSTIIFQSFDSAAFSFLETNDVEKPTLTASVNDQEYLENILIGKNPNIQISVYDKNGLDFRKAKIEFGINDQPIDDFEYEISGSANNLNFDFSPYLTPLDSNITVLINDASGNQSDTFRIAFVVSEKLDVLDYGNFPNPFTDRTVFAYELTEEADVFTITIYSVEGRRIRQLTDDDIITGSRMNLPGYHEVNWDGKNNDGVAVDNGNYFYQIRAKKNKKSIIKNGKIVRAK